MNRVLRVNEMSIQDKIDKKQIAARFEKDWKESTLKELEKDFPFVAEEFGKILGGQKNNRFAVFKSTTEEKYYNIMLFSECNEYSVVVKPDYIGCIMSSRYREPLEDWTRGSDLTDGKCTRETLLSVFADILRCELVSYEDSTIK